MDPITIGLGEKVIDILMPYVKKGKAKVSMEIEKGKKVTGVDIERL